MKLPRRRFLQLSATVAVSAASRRAWAQAYPARPVRLVVPFPPGGGFRHRRPSLGGRIKPLLGTVVIENVGGGGGSVGAALASRANPTATRCCWAAPPPTSPRRCSRPAAIRRAQGLSRSLRSQSPPSLAVHPSVPANNLELIAHAKANPGRLSYGTAGTGSLNHLTGEMFKLRVGLPDLIHVPYRGAGPASSTSWPAKFR